MFAELLTFVTCPHFTQDQKAFATAFITPEHKIRFNVSVPLLNNSAIYIGFSDPDKHTELLPGDNIAPKDAIFVPDDLMYSCFNATVNPTGGDYWTVFQQSCNFASFIGEFDLNFTQFYHQTLRHFGKIYIKEGTFSQQIPFVMEARIESNLYEVLDQYGMQVYDPIVYGDSIIYPVNGSYCNFATNYTDLSSTAPECDVACETANLVHEINLALKPIGENNRTLTFTMDYYKCSTSTTDKIEQEVEFRTWEDVQVNMLSRQLNPVVVSILDKNQYYFYSQDEIKAAYCDGDKLSLHKKEYGFTSCDKLAVKFEDGWVNQTMTYVSFKNLIEYIYQPGDTRVLHWHKMGQVCDALAYELYLYAQDQFQSNLLGLECGDGQVIVNSKCKDSAVVDGIVIGAAAVGAALGIL